MRVIFVPIHDVLDLDRFKLTELEVSQCDAVGQHLSRSGLVKKDETVSVVSSHLPQFHEAARILARRTGASFSSFAAGQLDVESSDLTASARVWVSFLLEYEVDCLIVVMRPRYLHRLIGWLGEIVHDESVKLSVSYAKQRCDGYFEHGKTYKKDTFFIAEKCKQGRHAFSTLSSDLLRAVLQDSERS